MSASGVVVPPGQYPPLAAITPTDHRAYIIISAAIGLSFTLLFAGIRVFIRRMVSPGWNLDDLFVGLATLGTLIQSILLFAACGDGWGKAIHLLTPKTASSLQKMYYASTLFYVFPVVLSKISVAYFLLRLTPVAKHKKFLHGVIAVTVGWGITMLFAIALSCRPSMPGIFVNQNCTGYFLRWEVLEIIGCILELAMFAMSMWLVWSLQTSRGRKGIVVAAFSFRLFLIIIVGFRLASFNDTGLTTDPSLLEAKFTAWTSAEMHYSTISATIPILRPLFNSLATHYGGGFGQSDSVTYGDSFPRSANRTRSKQAFEMKSMSASQNGVQSSSFATSASRHSMRAKSRAEEIVRPASSESKRMMIRKDITWTVNRTDDSL